MNGLSEGAAGEGVNGQSWVGLFEFLLVGAAGGEWAEWVGCCGSWEGGLSLLFMTPRRPLQHRVGSNSKMVFTVDMNDS